MKTKPVKVIYAEHVFAPEDIIDILGNTKVTNLSTRWIASLAGHLNFLSFYGEYSSEKLRRAAHEFFSIPKDESFNCRILMCVYPFDMRAPIMPSEVFRRTRSYGMEYVTTTTNAEDNTKNKRVLGYVVVPSVVSELDHYEMPIGKNSVDLFDLIDILEVLDQSYYRDPRTIESLFRIVRGQAAYMTAQKTYMCGEWNSKPTKKGEIFYF